MSEVVSGDRNAVAARRCPGRLVQIDNVLILAGAIARVGIPTVDIAI